MPAIKTTNWTSEFRNLARASERHGETNDCTVKAVAVVTGASYSEAHAACRRAGRKNRQGMIPFQIHNALSDLGFEVERIEPSDMIAQYPTKAARKLQNVTTHHPDRYNEFWADGNTYLFYTKGHINAVVDGANHDWTRGTAKRVQVIYRVVRAEDKKVTPEEVVVKFANVLDIAKKFLDIDWFAAGATYARQFDKEGAVFAVDNLNRKIACESNDRTLTSMTQEVQELITKFWAQK